MTSPISDDEAKALLVKLNEQPSLNAAPTISPQDANDFSSLVTGGLRKGLPALAGSIPGIGPPISAAAQAYEAADPGRKAVVKEAAQDALTRGGPLGWAATKAFGTGEKEPTTPETVESPGGMLNRVAEQKTAFPDIQAAPTLDPRYSQIGRPMGGIGGVGGSPGDGLKARFDSAQQNEIDQMRGARELEAYGGGSRIERQKLMAGENQLFADRQMAEAERQKQIEADTHDHFQRFMDKTNQMVDEVAQAKPDPGRYMRNQSVAMKINMGIGAIASGMLRGLTGGPNAFMQSVDHYINQDIDSQLAEIDNKKVAISSRQNMMQQFLNESGDRRLAADQYRRLSYEGIKQSLAAKDALYAVPEAQAGVGMAMNAIDQKIAGAQTNIAGAAWKYAQQQAAAAAAARAAAEKLAWERQIKLLELGQKQDEINIERTKAGKGDKKEDTAAITETTKRLADDDVIKNRDLIKSLVRKIDPKTGDIVGLGKGDAIRKAFAPEPGSSVTTMNPQGYIANKVVGLSDEENIANNEFDQLRLLYQQKITGAGGSPQQMEEIRNAFRGANTMAEKRRAIKMAEADLDRREGLAWANLDEDQKKTLQGRLVREGQAPMPSTVQVKK